MKKTAILTFLIIAAMLIAGCASQQVPVQPVAQEEQTPAEEVQAPVEQPEQPAEPAEETPAEEAPEEDTSGYNFDALPTDQQRRITQVRKLMDAARKSDENYFYRYSAPGISQTDVWVKGDLMKRSILRLDEVDKFHTYNMVYLDRVTFKAQGYCETTKSSCPNGHGPFTEEFSKRKLKTPKDWLLELDNNFYWVLDNKIGDQLYHIIDYRRSDGTSLRLFINNYKGWPARIQTHSTLKPDSLTPKTVTAEYLYDDMDIGGVSDEDVTPQ
jgi:hypothetical protein